MSLDDEQKQNDINIFRDLLEIDGFDLWEQLSNNKESTRNEVLHNIDDIYGTAALSMGPWKLVKGDEIAIIRIHLKLTRKTLFEFSIPKFKLLLVIFQKK